MEREELRLDIDVRTATMADVAAVVALWKVAGGPTRTPPTVEGTAKLMRTDAEALIVAEHGGRVVGTVIVGWDGWRCHLYRLAVDPAHRRRGVATALVEAALRRAEATGASRIDAMVDGANELGMAFWRESGFSLDQVERRWSLVVPS